jgi:ERCC4-type nuclease
MARKKERPLLTYVLDNREQYEYRLAAPDSKLFDDGGLYYDTLREGDLTAELDCERLDVIIERKQLNDFLACVGRERERFENEIARLAAHANPNVIIEAPASQIRAGSSRSLVNGTAAWNSIVHWRTVYPTIHWWTVTNHQEGAITARALIHEAAKHRISIED